MFAGKKSAQIREILISESAWEEMTCLFAPSLTLKMAKTAWMLALAERVNKTFVYSPDLLKIVLERTFSYGWPSTPVNWRWIVPSPGMAVSNVQGGTCHLELFQSTVSL